MAEEVESGPKRGVLGKTMAEFQGAVWDNYYIRQGLLVGSIYQAVAMTHSCFSVAACYGQTSSATYIILPFFIGFQLQYGPPLFCLYNLLKFSVVAPVAGGLKKVLPSWMNVDTYVDDHLVQIVAGGSWTFLFKMGWDIINSHARCMRTQSCSSLFFKVMGLPASVVGERFSPLCLQLHWFVYSGILWLSWKSLQQFLLWLAKDKSSKGTHSVPNENALEGQRQENQNNENLVQGEAGVGEVQAQEVAGVDVAVEGQAQEVARVEGAVDAQAQGVDGAVEGQDQGVAGVEGTVEAQDQGVAGVEGTVEAQDQGVAGVEGTVEAQAQGDHGPVQGQAQEVAGEGVVEVQAQGEEAVGNEVKEDQVPEQRGVRTRSQSRFQEVGQAGSSRGLTADNVQNAVLDTVKNTVSKTTSEKNPRANIRECSVMLDKLRPKSTSDR